MKNFIFTTLLFFSVLLSGCKNDVPGAPAEPSPKKVIPPPASKPTSTPSKPTAPSL